MKKHHKKIPFHLKHNYKQFQIGDTKFWAKNKSSAELYCKKIQWSPLALKEL